MSTSTRTTLNAIAAVLFVIAAVLLLVTGSTILGILFAVLAALEVFLVLRDRPRTS
jgi:zinc transporter ZupT